MEYGLIKVAAGVPAVKVADVAYNVQQIESLIAQAEGKGVEIIVFPELCITGYSCQDLFREQLLLDKAEEGLLLLEGEQLDAGPVQAAQVLPLSQRAAGFPRRLQPRPCKHLRISHFVPVLPG